MRRSPPGSMATGTVSTGENAKAFPIGKAFADSIRRSARSAEPPIHFSAGASLGASFFAPALAPSLPATCT